MFAFRKRLTNNANPTPGSPILSSKQRNTQQKESKLKRLLSRKPRQPQNSAEKPEDIPPNGLVPTRAVRPIQSTVNPFNEPRTSESTILQRTATIRMVQASANPIQEPQIKPPARSKPIATDSFPEATVHSFGYSQISSSDKSEMDQTKGPEGSIVNQFNLSSLDSSATASTIRSGVDPIWGPLLALPEAGLEALAMQHAPSSSTKSAHVLRYAEGRNNRLAIMQYGSSSAKCVIRIPACGWKGKWTENDKVTLERSAENMKYLKLHTSMPIPSVIDYDVEIDNILGAPYMILEYIEGKQPLELWWGDIYESDGDEIMEDGNDRFGGFHYKKVSTELEQKRQNILKSLACSMAELRSLKFGHLGTFTPTDKGPPTIEPTNSQPFGTMRDQHFRREIKKFTSSRAWLNSRLTQFYDDLSRMPNRPRGVHFHSEELELSYGLLRLYDMIVPELPLPRAGEPETFVIGPPNFTSQNILVDDDGNVAGFIDWDLLETRPQYLGWNTPPDWLFSDFMSPDSYRWPKFCMTPDDYARYRKDFARYLRGACGAESDGWKYSITNYMYFMIVESIASLDERKMTDTLIMVLSSFLPHMHFKAFIRQVGKSNEMGEEMKEYLKGQFRKLLATEEQNTVQGDQPATEKPNAREISSNTNVLDQTTSSRNSAAQEIHAPMAFSQSQQQQGISRLQNYRRNFGDQNMNSPNPDTFNHLPVPTSLSQRQQQQSPSRPQIYRRNFGDQNMSSSIPNTFDPFLAYLNHGNQPSPAQTLPQNSNQHLNPATSAHQPPVPPIQPTFATKLTVTAATNAQIQPSSRTQVSATRPRRTIPGEWPVDEHDNLLDEYEPVLPPIQVPDTATATGEARPRLPQRESWVIRMAGEWPVDGNGELLSDKNGGVCVIL